MLDERITTTNPGVILEAIKTFPIVDGSRIYVEALAFGIGFPDDKKEVRIVYEEVCAVKGIEPYSGIYFRYSAPSGLVQPELQPELLAPEQMQPSISYQVRKQQQTKEGIGHMLKGGKRNKILFQGTTPLALFKAVALDSLLAEGYWLDKGKILTENKRKPEDLINLDFHIMLGAQPNLDFHIMLGAQPIQCLGLDLSGAYARNTAVVGWWNALKRKYERKA